MYVIPVCLCTNAICIFCVPMSIHFIVTDIYIFLKSKSTDTTSNSSRSNANSNKSSNNGNISSSAVNFPNIYSGINSSSGISRNNKSKVLVE